MRNEMIPEMRRAELWMRGGKGASSEAIWGQMMNDKSSYPSYPLDSGDFGRCYCLLELIPEWKPRMREMWMKGKEWANLVDNWSHLTQLYEEGMLDELNLEIRRLVRP